MVTQRQHRLYTKIRKQLITVYEKKEEVRLNILTIPGILEKFYDTIETDNEKRQQLDPIIGDKVFPNVPFLEILLKDLHICQEKSMVYLTKNVAVHKEVDRTMKAFIKASNKMGAEEFTTKESAVLIEKLTARINKIEKKIISSKEQLSVIQKEFMALQIRYQYLNN